MEARYIYIQNTNNPKDPEPEGKFYALPEGRVSNLPPGFVAWKAYGNKEPNAKDIGMNMAAFHAWLKDKNKEDQEQGSPAIPD